MSVSDFETFVGPFSVIAGSGHVPDHEAHELLRVVTPNVEADGWVVHTDEHQGVTYWAHEGDDNDGVVAFHGDRPVGLYEGLVLWVNPAWRGRGIGSRLVAEIAKLRQGSAVDHESAVAFSDDGWRCHERGFEIFCEECTPACEPSR